MQTDEPDRFFSIAEACRILGWERSTVYSRIKAGRLKAIRLNMAVIRLRRSLSWKRLPPWSGELARHWPR
jgi:excisionase family DNA binding protein